MKLHLQTKLFPQYDTIVTLAEQSTIKKEEEQKKAEEAAKQEEIEQLYNDLNSIRSFAIGTTPNFTIDLNKDLLSLEDLEQVQVTFGQFGKVVQREILYFSDNYVINSEGELTVDDKLIFEDGPIFKHYPAMEDVWDNPNDMWDNDGSLRNLGFFNSEGTHKWRHHYQSIRNPKFTYDKVYNKLVLTLSQFDTLHKFKPTDWNYGEEEPTEMPYFKNNPSLVVMEVKYLLNHRHRHQVIVRPQEYIAVADTIEHSLDGDKTMPIFVSPRFRMEFGDFWEDEDIKPLPQRAEDLPNHIMVEPKQLLQRGINLWSRPRFKEEEDSEGTQYVDEFSRYFCIAIPLHIKLKVKSIKVMVGGSPGLMDHVTYDYTGLQRMSYDSEGKLVPDSESYTWYDSEFHPAIPRVIPKPKYNENETVYFNSNYMIDPSMALPENPMGEYVVWYVCSRETPTYKISRYFGGPYLYHIEFEEVYG